MSSDESADDGGGVDPVDFLRQRAMERQPRCFMCCLGAKSSGTGADELLLCGCRCRGDTAAAHVHVDCAVNAAHGNVRMWFECPTCRHEWTGELLLRLSNAWRLAGAPSPPEEEVRELNGKAVLLAARRLVTMEQEHRAARTASSPVPATPSEVARGLAYVHSLGAPPTGSPPRPAGETAAEEAYNRPGTVHGLLTSVRLTAFAPTFSSEGYEFVVDLLDADPADIEELLTKCEMKRPEKKRLLRAVELALLSTPADGGGLGLGGSAVVETWSPLLQFAGMDGQYSTGFSAPSSPRFDALSGSSYSNSLGATPTRGDHRAVEAADRLAEVLEGQAAGMAEVQVAQRKLLRQQEALEVRLATCTSDAEHTTNLHHSLISRVAVVFLRDCL